MIDVHILTMPNRDQWLNECLVSLEGQPVNIHIVEGIKNHIGKGRLKGFSKGTCDWVSFVDDDDLVLPGAFEVVESTIKDFPEAKAIFTREERINNYGKIISQAKYIPERFNLPHIYSSIRWDHHLTVFHRETLNQILQNFEYPPYSGERYICTKFIKNYPCVMHPMIAYQWRIHNDNNYKRVYRKSKI